MNTKSGLEIGNWGYWAFVVAVVLIVMHLSACAPNRVIIRRDTCVPVCHQKYCAQYGISPDTAECDEATK